MTSLEARRRSGGRQRGAAERTARRRPGGEMFCPWPTPASPPPRCGAQREEVPPRNPPDNLPREEPARPAERAGRDAMKEQPRCLPIWRFAPQTTAST